MAAEIVLGLLGLLGDLRGQDVVGERGLVSPVIFGETPDVVEVTGTRRHCPSGTWHILALALRKHTTSAELGTLAPDLAPLPASPRLLQAGRPQPHGQLVSCASQSFTPCHPLIATDASKLWLSRSGHIMLVGRKKP